MWNGGGAASCVRDGIAYSAICTTNYMPFLLQFFSFFSMLKKKKLFATEYQTINENTQRREIITQIYMHDERLHSEKKKETKVEQGKSQKNNNF